eukprot:TRINITY_DN4732_c0_g1_i1.p2 TRINITY_DN4732_c0_g1~~TRINITY_DN4732_c0_g1_i1.p2  ORF type:complete len:695 (-),score=171.05 TRINITY_DN4732_c0_g1_i1:4202-6265(-)
MKTLSGMFSPDWNEKILVRSVQWLPDSSGFTYNECKKVMRSNVDVLEPELCFLGNELNMMSYFTTQNPDILLILGDKKPIWRHSFLSKSYLYHLSSGDIRVIANGELIQNAELSPDSSKVSYVKDQNMFIFDIDSEDILQITTTGSDNVLNGVFDWVYEEEFGRKDAYRWSPDSHRIAYWITDQSTVKDFYIMNEDSNYCTISSLKYPKVGEENSKVTIGVYDILSGESKHFNFGEDNYVPRIHWGSDPNSLFIQVLNRNQNVLELVHVNVVSDKVTVILTETCENGWIDVSDDFKFLKNGDIVWTSEKDGYRNIYKKSPEEDEINLTKRDWDVDSIIGVDEVNQYVYFYGKEIVLEKHVYRIKLDGSNLEKITEEPGVYDVKYSPNYEYFVGEYSTVTKPTTVGFYKCDGTLLKVIETNETIIQKLENNPDIPFNEFSSFTTEDGVELNCCIMKPPNFDENQKYPVIIHGYGMPGHQLVLNRWGNFKNLFHQYMANKDFVIFCMDNRGTGGRGRDFKHLSYGDISKWLVNDFTQGAIYLSQLDFIDPERIGIWGWSGGGYLTSMMMFRSPELFQVGVAVAPLIDLLNYDTIWTERYMNVLEENKEGYESANPMKYARDLIGDLLLIHGSEDDNVHPLNTMQLANTLIKSGKDFDMMVYPGRNHAIYGDGARIHLFRKIAQFFINNL